MPVSSLGPIDWIDLKRCFENYLFSYHYLQRSDFGYHLTDKERIYALALINSWDDIRSRVVTFQIVRSSCSIAEKGKIVLPSYEYQWNDQSEDESATALGFFLQTYAENERRNGLYADKVIIHSLMFYFEDLLDLMKKILVEDENIDSDRAICIRDKTADLIYDPIFQELISAQTAFENAMQYIDELEERMKA